MVANRRRVTQHRSNVFRAPLRTTLRVPCPRPSPRRGGTFPPAPVVQRSACNGRDVWPLPIQNVKLPPGGSCLWFKVPAGRRMRAGSVAALSPPRARATGSHASPRMAKLRCAATSRRARGRENRCGSRSSATGGSRPGGGARRARRDPPRDTTHAPRPSLFRPYAYGAPPLRRCVATGLAQR
jgi:hypothetical protein